MLLCYLWWWSLLWIDRQNTTMCSSPCWPQPSFHLNCDLCLFLFLSSQQPGSQIKQLMTLHLKWLVLTQLERQVTWIQEQYVRTLLEDEICFSSLHWALLEKNHSEAVVGVGWEMKITENLKLWVNFAEVNGNVLQNYTQSRFDSPTRVKLHFAD